MQIDSPVHAYQPGQSPTRNQAVSGYGGQSLWYGESTASRSAVFESGQVYDANEFFTARDLRPGRSFRPMCVMFWGRRSQGKTLAMTILAEAMRQAYLQQGVRYHRKYKPWGRRIFANYHMQPADMSNPMLVDMLVDFPRWGRNGLACVDEILAYFPNRRSLARPNLNFSTFLQQIRKLQMELFFTTQFPQNMDGQILQQIDLFAMPERINGGRDLRIKFWDWWGQYTGKMWKKSWPPLDEPHDYEIILYDVKKFYGYYPTEEVVAPMWLDQRADIMERGWKRELEAIEAKQDVRDQMAQIQKASDLQSRGYVEDLDQLVDSFPNTVALGRVLAKAKDLDPDNIRNQKDLGEYLRAKGWTVTKSGNLMTAERP